MTTDTHTTNRGESPRADRLERPVDGRVIAGVAEGLGRRLGISTGWVRLGFVIAAFSGFGLVAYAIGWLAMPDERDDQSVLERYLGNLRDWSSWIGVALIGLAVLIIIDRTGLISGELLFAGALIGLGVVLYRGDIGRKAPASPEPDGSGDTDLADPLPPADPTPAGDSGGGPPEFDNADFDDATTEASMYDGGGAAPPPSPPVARRSRPPRPPRPRREPSRLGRYTIATALLGIGGIAAYDAGTTAEVAYAVYLAAFMIVIGAGLLVGAWVGRARWLVVPGLLLLPVFITLSVLPVTLSGGIGERSLTGIQLLERGGREEMAIGDLYVDLRDIPLGTDADLTVELGIGQLVVVVPDDRTVEIDAHVGMGQLQIAGRSTGGLGVDRVSVLGEGDTRLVLTAELGIGELEIRRSTVSESGSLSRFDCLPGDDGWPFVGEHVCSEVGS